MRFFWPIRERALSSDSEASTASQSSLASDASFYSAADEAGSDWFDFRPISDEAGVGVHTFAPVSASTSAENGAVDAPRAVPLLGTGCDSAAATSGTCPGHAAPIARQAHTRAEASGAQAEARPPRSLPRRFATARLATDPAGHPAGLVGPEHLGPTIPESLASQAVQPVRPESAEHTQASRLPLGAPPNAGPGAAHTPPPGLQARPMAGQGPRPAPPPHSRAQDPPCEVAPPGRAAGRLPDPVAPGASLAAATARALAVSHWPWELAEDSSDDEDGQDDPAAAPEPRQDPMRMLPRPGRAGGMLHDDIALGAASARAQAAPAGPHDLAGGPSATAATQQDRAAPTRPVQVQEVLAPPGRAGGMLPDSVAVGSAPSAIASSPAAAAAAAPATAAAAAHVVCAAARADVEHNGHARPPQELTSSARLRVELLQGGASSSSGSGTTPEDDGNGDDAADSRLVLSDDVAVPMDVDFGTRCPVQLQQPLQPPQSYASQQQPAGSARDDGDDAFAGRTRCCKRTRLTTCPSAQAIHGQRSPSLRPRRVRAQRVAVRLHAVRVHGGAASQHSSATGTLGTDAQPSSTSSRRAVRAARPSTRGWLRARHAPACASPSSTSIGNDSSTQEHQATLTPEPTPPSLQRLQAEPDLPPRHGARSVPPLASSTDVDVADCRTGRWANSSRGPLVTTPLADRLGETAHRRSLGPPLPRTIVAPHCRAT
ncbi:hypothetical protein Pcac1_g28550 [Phytophthora cactorum]|nr:hypothetical protein Pcac1_g28550 [Phytophthora cactorum]